MISLWPGAGLDSHRPGHFLDFHTLNSAEEHNLNDKKEAKNRLSGKTI